MKHLVSILATTLAVSVGAAFTSAASAGTGSGKVTLIHTGDIHGNLVPRHNLRSDAIGRSMEGGLARMYTIIKDIRKEATEKGVDYSLLINTGDSVQGSAEALFSRGQVMIDVLNLFGYVAHGLGNWDYLYGTARFEETFKGTATAAPLANWGALASNLYYTNQFDDTAMCGVKATDPATNTLRPRKRVLPTYTIKQVGNVKVGILGVTGARAIAAVGTSVTRNYTFTDAKTEVPCFVNHLRTVENVDVVVMISELEMARDVQIAETATFSPDVILNSDMHERTTAPIVVARTNIDGIQTLIVEEGHDGTMVGKLNLAVKNGKIITWTFQQRAITDDIKEDATVAAKVAQVRAPYVTGTFVAGQTVTVGGNTTVLRRPVDEIIAYTQVGLHRSNFVNEDMPGVVEGSSHNLIADAMAVIGMAQTASIRGFRYGTGVPPGPITMGDIYTYIPIVAKLGRTAKACGADLKRAIEQSIGGVFQPEPTEWAGGWMFAYSGLTMNVDACDGFMGATASPVTVIGPTLANRTAPWSSNRGSNIKVLGNSINENDLYDGRPTLIVGGVSVANPGYQQCTSGAPGYTVTGYWFADDPTTINNCPPPAGVARFRW